MNFDGGWTTLVARAGDRSVSDSCGRSGGCEVLAGWSSFAVVKIGFRVPSLKKRIRARTSWKRALRPRAGDRLRPMLNPRVPLVSGLMLGGRVCGLAR